MRRYGSITERVESRLREEFRLIERNGMAGFLLLYREIALLARQIMEERGLVGPEIALEERPPGRGRGSSVALLAGYLVGISHVDPLKWDLTLERFISEDCRLRLPDIDLDFPRAIRDELIERVHRRFGSAFAVLTGAVSTYRSRGVIRDLGGALGLPGERLRLLAGRMHDEDMGVLSEKMERDARVRRTALRRPSWRHFAELAPQLIGAPKSLGQHVGGMILSSSPIPEMVPVRAGAMEGRYIMDWDRDSVADAGFAKIDILSLPVLDQIEDALDLIEMSGRERPDMSRIDPEDPDGVRHDQRGPLQGRVPSPVAGSAQAGAQAALPQPSGPRLPGGADKARGGSRRKCGEQVRRQVQVRRGLGVRSSAGGEGPRQRGYGIIVWQEQVVQLLMDVGGMSAVRGGRGEARLRKVQQRPPGGDVQDVASWRAR